MENKALMVLHIKNGDALLKKISGGKSIGISLTLMAATLFWMHIRLNEQDAKIDYLNRQIKAKELELKGE